MKSYLKRKQSQNNLATTFRRAVVETLEERRLLTASIESLDSTSLRSSAIISHHVHQANQIFGAEQPLATIDHFESEAEAKTAIEQYVDNYWSALFDRELDQDLWHEYIDQQELVPSFHPPLVDYIGINPVLQGSIEVVDGAYLFILRQGPQTPDVALNNMASTIEILDIRDPASIVSVGSIDVRGVPSKLMVSGNRLVAVSDRLLQIFDVEDKSQPRLVTEITVEGQIQEARLLSGKLVVQSHRKVKLPAPRFFPSDEMSDQLDFSFTPIERSLGRFEARDAYLARVANDLIGEFIPDITFGGHAATDAGDWRDFTIGKQGLSTLQSSVMVVDIQADSPLLQDSEVISGVQPDFVFVDADSVYLVDVRAQQEAVQNNDIKSDIYRISLLTSNGGVELAADAAGSVTGAPRNSHDLDEHLGDLRIVTNVQLGGDEYSANTLATNLYVLREVNGQLQEIGSLTDIADGHHHFGTYFAGDQAIVTRKNSIDGFNYNDPLYFIDLSDPGQPVELSEIATPGINKYFHRVSPDLIVGVGFVEADVTLGQLLSYPGIPIRNVDWRLQVSLLDVSDPMLVKTLSEFIVEDSFFDDLRWGISSLTVHFDEASGLLSVANVPQREASNLSTLVFQIDPAAEQPLTLLGNLATGQAIFARTFVANGAVFGASPTEVLAAAIHDLETPYDPFYFDQGANDDYLYAAVGDTSQLLVMENDRVPNGTRITSISQSNRGASVSIAVDGRSLFYEPHDGVGHIDRLVYTITLPDGSTQQAEVKVQIVRGPADHFQPLPYSDESRVEIGVRLVDADGNVASSVQVGDHLWVELGADDIGPSRGIFQGTFRVELDPNELQVIGEPEAVEPFTGGVNIVKSDNGFAELSAFSRSITPLDGYQTLFRFEVEVLKPGNIEVIASPATSMLNLFLAHGLNSAINPTNVTSGSAMVAARQGFANTEVVSFTDVNDDGATTPLDLLLVINHLNRRSAQGMFSPNAEGETEAAAVQLDVNRDGIVSPLDILHIVNKLNSQPTRPEGESSVVVRHPGVRQQFSESRAEESIAETTAAIDDSPVSDAVYMTFDTLSDLRRRP